MNIRTLKNIALIVGFLSSLSAQASSLESAIERTNRFDFKQWTFQVISKGEDDTVELYNPQKSPEWSLSSINGKTPTQKQLKTYRLEKEEEAAEDEEDGEEINLHEMFEANSLQLISEDSNIAKYSFDPRLDEDEADFSGKLKGELWHNKERDFIERFDFFSIKPFSPMSGVKIKNMRTSIRFKEIDRDVFAPDQIFSEVSGNAFIVKKIDEKESQTYANFRRISSK